MSKLRGMFLRIAAILMLALPQISCEGKNSDDAMNVLNVPPIAVAKANVLSGEAPLVVQFSGSNSTDDKTIATFSWDFKNGLSSNKVDPQQTFNTAGTYNVQLIVKDEEGLSHKDEILISVNEPINPAPVAVASADVFSGYAPLLVSFTGSNSSDDQGIESYSWRFKDGSESGLTNPSHTFHSPGVYDVDLIVNDNQGSSNVATITIVVEKECVTNGGNANESGLKTWCWDSIDIPTGEPGNNSFSDGQLGLASECNPNLITKDGHQLRFDLNPTVPAAQSWCRNDFNMRAEISTNPWQVNQPLGTEEWLGWSYTFGDDYVVDSHNPWLFFQMHQGIAGSPPHHIGVHPIGYYGAQNGEIVISNVANKTEDHDRTLTGIVPKAGTTLNIVVHVIHDLGSKGLLQVWIDGNMVYNKQVGTVHEWAAWGGNAKFGIYKWPWKDEENIQNSIDEGSNQLTTYMGALSILTRKPGDANYGANSYDQVAPY